MAGNNAGMAVGQPVFASDLRGVDTPALFYLPRPMGELTPSGSSFQQLGGLIKTTFVF